MHKYNVFNACHSMSTDLCQTKLYVLNYVHCKVRNIFYAYHYILCIVSIILLFCFMQVILYIVFHSEYYSSYSIYAFFITEQCTLHLIHSYLLHSFYVFRTHGIKTNIVCILHSLEYRIDRFHVLSEHFKLLETH